MKLSSRHEWVRRSELRSMSVECERVGGVNLSQGVCDLTIPAPVRAAAHAAIDSGPNSYSRHDGTAAMRRAVADYYRVRLDRDVDAERNVVVTAGATGALYCACLALLEPGDEVILFEPYYSYHQSTLLATGAVPVFVATDAPEWDIPFERVAAARTSRTKAIIVNTPGNPSGKVWRQDELEQLAAFCEEHDLIVFTDEIYEHFVYDDRRHISPARLPNMWDRTVTISGLSKTFSITGWRIGYSVSPQRTAEAIGNFSDLIYVCAPTPLQMGAAAGLVELDDAYFRGLAEEYCRKRDRLCEVLTDIGLRPYTPEGAYYVLADVSKLPGRNGSDRAMHLLHETGVATVPGESFFTGDAGASLVRFCFAKEDDVLDDACRRLHRLGRCTSSAALP